MVYVSVDVPNWRAGADVEELLYTMLMFLHLLISETFLRNICLSSAIAALDLFPNTDRNIWSMSFNCWRTLRRESLFPPSHQISLLSQRHVTCSKLVLDRIQFPPETDVERCLFFLQINRKQTRGDAGGGEGTDLWGFTRTLQSLNPGFLLIYSHIKVTESFVKIKQSCEIICNCF